MELSIEEQASVLFTRYMADVKIAAQKIEDTTNYEEVALTYEHLAEVTRKLGKDIAQVTDEAI